MGHRLSIRIDSKLMENFLLMLVSLAILHVYFYSNAGIQYIFLFSSFIILFVIALFYRLLNNPFFLRLVMFNLMSVILTMIFYGGYGIALIFFDVLMVCLLFNNISISQTTFKKMHFLIALGLTVFIVTADVREFRGDHITTLFHDTINVNTYAIFVLAACYSWLCFLSVLKWKKSFVFIMNIVVIGISGYYIYSSRSRTTLLALLLLVLLLLLVRKPLYPRRLRWISVITLIASIMIVPVYTYLASLQQEIIILGKPLFNGRQYVWMSAWKHYCQSPLIGKGTSVYLFGASNRMTVSAHNTLLSMLYTLGIVPTSSFAIMLNRFRSKPGSVIVNRVTQMVFISSLLLTFFESFYTDSHFFLLFLVHLLPITIESELGHDS